MHLCGTQKVERQWNGIDNRRGNNHKYVFQSKLLAFFHDLYMHIQLVRDDVKSSSARRSQGNLQEGAGRQESQHPRRSRRQQLPSCHPTSQQSTAEQSCRNDGTSGQDWEPDTEQSQNFH